MECAFCRLGNWRQGSGPGERHDHTAVSPDDRTLRFRGKDGRWASTPRRGRNGASARRPMTGRPDRRNRARQFRARPGRRWSLRSGGRRFCRWTIDEERRSADRCGLPRRHEHAAGQAGAVRIVRGHGEQGRHESSWAKVKAVRDLAEEDIVCLILGGTVVRRGWSGRPQASRCWLRSACAVMDRHSRGDGRYSPTKWPNAYRRAVCKKTMPSMARNRLLQQHPVPQATARVDFIQPSYNPDAASVVLITNASRAAHSAWPALSAIRSLRTSISTFGRPWRNAWRSMESPSRWPS